MEQCEVTKPLEADPSYVCPECDEYPVERDAILGLCPFCLNYLLTPRRIK